MILFLGGMQHTGGGPEHCTHGLTDMPAKKATSSEVHFSVVKLKINSSPTSATEKLGKNRVINFRLINYSLRMHEHNTLVQLESWGLHLSYTHHHFQKYNWDLLSSLNTVNWTQVRLWQVVQRDKSSCLCMNRCMILFTVTYYTEWEKLDLRWGRVDWWRSRCWRSPASGQLSYRTSATAWGPGREQLHASCWKSEFGKVVKWAPVTSVSVSESITTFHVPCHIN